MKTVKLSKPLIDAAPLKTSRYTLWCGDLGGFGVRIEPSGRKTFVVRYLAEGGGRGAPQRQVTIGSYSALTVVQAREKAKDVLAQVRGGADPMAAIAAKRREMTVAALVDLYEKEGLIVQRGIRIGTPMKPLTAKYTMARLRHHVVPLLGTKRASEVTEADIVSFARAVANGKTAKDEKTGHRARVIVRGGEGAARKVVRDLSAVFAFGMSSRIVTSNPVAAASVRKTDNRRERYLTMDEIKRLGDALVSLEEEGVNAKAVNIARLWALTGCRRNEIAGLKWSEVDLERGLLLFDDSKTGRSVRPLGGAAVALLQALMEEADKEALANGDFVFPAERGLGFYQGTKQVWPVAIKRANLPGVSPHVLRHTLGSAAASAGEALLMVGSLLGHANARSTTIYAHVAHDPARLAADRVTEPLAAALGRSAPKAVKGDEARGGASEAHLEKSLAQFATGPAPRPGARSNAKRKDENPLQTTIFD